MRNNPQRREPFPKGRTCKPLTTLYMSNETSTAYVIKGSFKALGGVERRLRVLKGSTKADGGYHESIDLRNTALLERAVIETGARLLIIDPVQSFMGDVDSHKATEVRPVMDGPIKLAERQKLSMTGIKIKNRKTMIAMHAQPKTSPRLESVNTRTPQKLFKRNPSALQNHLLKHDPVVSVIFTPQH
jgi:hypothetical protein